jgi:hypothetical protein
MTSNPKKGIPGIVFIPSIPHKGWNMGGEPGIERMGSTQKERTLPYTSFSRPEKPVDHSRDQAVCLSFQKFSISPGIPLHKKKYRPHLRRYYMVRK